MSDMKILRLELHNFARVYSGLSKTKITLNFEDFENPINIFVGANGSGKSSIMRCLHPFAYNNAMGITDTKSKLIMDNRDGKKFIDIMLDDNLYTIQHHYKRKKDDSLSIESYIQENGIELNENGTVTMFKEIVEDKLGVTESYLTLLSIGNSMSSFVDFTAGDRKSFATKIFTDLEIYQDYYKKMTTKSRKMKTLLNNVVDKLSKYAGTDKTELNSQLNTVRKSILEQTSVKTSILQTIGKIQNQLDTYKETKSEYEELQYTTNELLTQLTSLQSKKKFSISKDELIKQHKIESKKLSDTELSLVEYRTKSTNIIDNKELMLSRIFNLNDNKRKILNNENIDELETLISRLDDKIKSINSIKSDKFNGLTKDDFIKIQIHLDQVQSICNKLLTDVINIDVVPKLFDEYKDDNSLYKKLEDKFNRLGSNIQNFTIVNLTRIANKANLTTKCDKSKGCDYYEFYKDYIKIINQTTEESNNELSEMKSELSRLEDKMIATSIIHEAIKYINKNNIILKVPSEIFDPSQFIYDFIDCREVYNKTAIINYIDQLESLDMKKSLIDKRDLTKDKIAQYNANKSILDSIDSEIIECENKLESLDSDLSHILLEINNLTDKQNLLTENVEAFSHDIDICSSIDDIRLKIDVIKERVLKMDSQISKITDLENKLNEYYSKRDECDRKLSELNVMEQKFVIVINDIISLEEEELKIREDYDIITAIRRAVSPTTGIPLEFIEDYVKRKMAGRINELLDSVYHGRLRLLIDDIIVSDKEFTIPYMKNNTKISDISTASDGERAIMTLAFSLVLIQLSLTKYNIMLVDELDTTLDTETRSKFIGIIQNYMKLINSNQIFLISHNNMFDMYRVNLIMTSEITTSTFDSDCVLELYK